MKEKLKRYLELKNEILTTEEDIATKYGVKYLEQEYVNDKKLQELNTEHDILENELFKMVSVVNLKMVADESELIMCSLC